MTTLERTADFVPPSDPRPRAATGRGHLLRAEIGRLRRRRLVLLVLGLATLALLGAMVAVFFTHSNDLAGARADAVQQAQQANEDQQAYHDQCLKDPTIPDADKQAGACGPDQTEAQPADAFFQDPRLRADVGLPIIAIAVAVAGALVGALVGATAVGADWSSRAMLTLITWEPRRVRLLTARFTAVAVVTAVVALVAQAVALGLGALVVATRGTWQTSPQPDGDAVYYSQPAIIGPAHFWRDLVSLQVRGVGLVVLVAVTSAAVTMLTRHTAALLGLGFFWVAIVENAVRALFGSRGWPRWLLTENVVAYLQPGGSHLSVGQHVDRTGSVVEKTVLVSNLDALLYLGVVGAVFVVASAVLLRRRDL
ncbi:hypothetical protein GCM10027446_12480 [Angustibacter peucedani]